MSYTLHIVAYRTSEFQPPDPENLTLTQTGLVLGRQPKGQWLICMAPLSPQAHTIKRTQKLTYKCTVIEGLNNLK